LDFNFSGIIELIFSNFVLLTFPKFDSPYALEFEFFLSRENADRQKGETVK
jgi:hypothetical protein